MLRELRGARLAQVPPLLTTRIVSDPTFNPPTASTPPVIDPSAGLPSVLVTGAAGFVGAATCAYLAARGLRVRAASRAGLGPRAPKGVADVAVGEVGPGTDWRAALEGASAVVHLAGLAHRGGAAAADRAAFDHTNVEGTLRLAHAALEAGVRRFVFVSSIGVHGHRSDRPLTEADAPAPVEPYAHSKLEAERRLAALCEGAPMRPVVLRPALVYGPGCPGNLQRLMRLVATGLPLPFGSVTTRRAMVGIDPLVALIEACVHDPRAEGETFVAADVEAPTLRELIVTLAEGMGRRARLLPVPPGLLRTLAGLVGRAADIDRLTAPLRVDACKARRLLGWASPIAQREGLLRTAAAYAAGTSR